MKLRRGIVSLAGRRVGTIEEVAGGGTRFKYDSQWLKTPGAIPISVTLPLREEPYDSAGLHPFFANLLPEGWLLDFSTKQLKISKDDPFGLMLATCKECIGAVEIEDADKASPSEADESARAG
ncbi:MAG: HipA N-terminal domain-containing protein [Tepidisphaeraceae bacterium]